MGNSMVIDTLNIRNEIRNTTKDFKEQDAEFARINHCLKKPSNSQIIKENKVGSGYLIQSSKSKFRQSVVLQKDECGYQYIKLKSPCQKLLFRMKFTPRDENSIEKAGFEAPFIYRNNLGLKIEIWDGQTRRTIYLSRQTRKRLLTTKTCKKQSQESLDSARRALEIVKRFKISRIPKLAMTGFKNNKNFNRGSFRPLSGDADLFLKALILGMETSQDFKLTLNLNSLNLGFKGFLRSQEFTLEIKEQTLPSILIEIGVLEQFESEFMPKVPHRKKGKKRNKKSRSRPQSQTWKTSPILSSKTSIQGCGGLRCMRFFKSKKLIFYWKQMSAHRLNFAQLSLDRFKGVQYEGKFSIAGLQRKNISVGKKSKFFEGIYVDEESSERIELIVVVSPVRFEFYRILGSGHKAEFVFCEDVLSPEAKYLVYRVKGTVSIAQSDQGREVLTRFKL